MPHSTVAHTAEEARLQRTEARLLRRRAAEEAGAGERLIGKHVPEKLEQSLDAAFAKAFSLVSWHRAASQRRRRPTQSAEMAERRAAYRMEGSRAALRSLSCGACFEGAKGAAVAGGTGGALGLFGIGLADLALVCSRLLETCARIATLYGFSSEAPVERLFTLRLLEVAFLRGDDFLRGHQALDQWIREGRATSPSEEVQRKRTGKALAGHLLCFKFLQGIPLVGCVGGISDAACILRASQYARLCYEKRFLYSSTKP